MATEPAAAPSIALRFKAPFAEQLAYFRGKRNLPTTRWDDVRREAHDRAFIVAGVTKADLLQDLREAVDKAIAQGTGLAAFRKDFAGIVKKHGWDYTGSFDWRTRVIYQTNLNQSYQAGRYAQLTHPALLKARPYWRYIHADGVANPRPLHLSWHGITLPHDDPWWRTHFGGNGWGCHCRVQAVGEREYHATPAQYKTAPDDGQYVHVDALGNEHLLPRGVTYGFDYTPGASVKTTWSRLIQDKLIRWDARIGADCWAELSEALAPALRDEFAGWARELLATRQGGRGGARVIGALSPRVVARLAQLDPAILPASAHIQAQGQNVTHAFRPEKVAPVPLDWYLDLPLHLRHPRAVLLDRTHERPALLYVFDGPAGERVNKLVVQIDYTVKAIQPSGGRVRVPVNTAHTATAMSVSLLRYEGYELLEGSLD